MRVKPIAIAAGETVRLGGGNFFMLVETAGPVDVQLFREGAPTEDSADDVEAGYKAQRPLEWNEPPTKNYFDYVEVYSPTAQTIRYGVSRGVGGYDRNIGAVDATFVLGDTITAEAARVSVGIAATALVAAGSGRKSVRFYNAGTADVWIGSAAVTTGNGAVKIAPGQLWVERDAPNAAWYGISGTAGQNVGVQVVS